MQILLLFFVAFLFTPLCASPRVPSMRLLFLPLTLQTPAHIFVLPCLLRRHLFIWTSTLHFKILCDTWLLKAIRKSRIFVVETNAKASGGRWFHFYGTKFEWLEGLIGIHSPLFVLDKDTHLLLFLFWYTNLYSICKFSACVCLFCVFSHGFGTARVSFFLSSSSALFLPSSVWL